MKLLLHPTADVHIQAVILNAGGSVLLHGVKGVGKRSVAKAIARQLNCQGCTAEDCRSCRMVLGGNHPDVIFVNPDAKDKIGIEQIHQLLHDLRYERYEPTGKRVVVIGRSHRLTLPAQNALLKGLEEPPGSTTIILTCENLQSLLPTVISRCRSIHVPRVSDNSLSTFLHHAYPNQVAQIREVVDLSQGAVGMALSLMEDPADLERHRKVMSEVAQLLEVKELFEKLQRASAMAGNDQLDDYVTALTSVSQMMVRQGKNSGNLRAIEQLRQRLAANVSPRTALEALAVELL